MLIKAKTLKGYKLDSLDGEIGKVEEFYFDDQHWAIRYLVADTGKWLIGRQVLISPHALTAVSKEDQHLAINLTKKQIEDSPSLDTAKPVSRQFEESYHGYYGWPLYWTGAYMWGYYPQAMGKLQVQGDPTTTRTEKEWDVHLRSTHEVSGYHIKAADGELGHIEDFIIDDETWAIRYLIIDTQNWWPGRKVLISPQWIERISLGESKVLVNLPREIIKQSPEYEEKSPITREYETSLHQYYNRQGYWDAELEAVTEKATH